ncbi:glycosyltransferase family 4 protein [Bacillota bacterium]
MLTFVANSCADVFEQVYILSFYAEIIDFKLNKQIKLINLPGQLEYPNYKRSLYNKIIDALRLIKALRKEFVRLQPDLLCAFGIGHVYICLLAAFNLNIKVIGSERRSPADLSLFWKSVSKLFYANCDGMVFQLEEAKKFYCKSKSIMDKSAIIPNPYLSGLNYVPCAAEIREKTISAGAARFEYEKGFDVLIKAFKFVKEKHGNYRLIIYGKDDFTKYDSLIEYLDLKGSIEFPGLVEDIAAKVYSTSVFVLPSRFEGIPNILLEVMGAGVPTVSSDCPPGGPRLLTDEGRRGMLVPVEDYYALGTAICTIIEDKSLSSKLSNSSLEIRNQFDPTLISRKWIEYFTKVLNE